MAKKQIKKSSNPILDTILAKLNEAFEELSREAKVAYKSKEFAKALENVLIALFGTTLSTFLLSALFV
jgi:DNA-binding TFAR19-related protein (PDSD5 family)